MLPAKNALKKESDPSLLCPEPDLPRSGKSREVTLRIVLFRGMLEGASLGRSLPC
jgi:hypothetical protein